MLTLPTGKGILVLMGHNGCGQRKGRPATCLKAYGERSMTEPWNKVKKGRRAMEHRIIFATSNQGKMREIREILKRPGDGDPLHEGRPGVQADIVEDRGYL